MYVLEFIAKRSLLIVNVNSRMRKNLLKWSCVVPRAS